MLKCGHIQALPGLRKYANTQMKLRFSFAACSAPVYLVAMSEVSRILESMEQGDAQAASKLLPLVYDELRRLAGASLGREKAGQTLDATGLVHEAYLRLVGQNAPKTYKDRGHFFATAACAMRRILIDNARKKQAARRGGGRRREQLVDVAAPETDEELLALDQALDKLAVQEPVKARLVELRYFAGLTSDQAAQVLDISPATADRYWAYARAWLQAEVRGT
jgi:RNA polymerase sigma factor (TIGR02999 family)